MLSAAVGRERPRVQKYRYLPDFLLERIDFERQGRLEQSAGNGWEWNALLKQIPWTSIDFKPTELIGKRQAPA